MTEKLPVFVGQRLRLREKSKTLTVLFRDVFTTVSTQVDSPRGAVLIDSSHVLFFFTMEELDRFERIPETF